ncbi:MAG: hypothetical protein ACRDNS_08180 [Trebonia sp.]
MDRHDLASRLMLVAGQALESGSGSLAELPQGVQAVDSWQNERFGGVLFWIDESLDLNGWGKAVLHDTMLRRDGHDWRPMGAGATGTGTAEEVAAEKGPGLHWVSTTSQDPVRLVTAVATPEVFAIELRSARASTSRRPGRDGFCLLGITHSDPITYANALDHDGRPIAGEPLLL